MRADALGMFWEERPAERGKRAPRPMPPIPDTGWTAPKDFPNLSHAKVIGLDTETYDPHLLTHGPGWARDDGHICGISLAVENKSWYFPIRHTVQTELNLPVDNVLAYMRDTLGAGMPKVGANIAYDVGWFQHEGITVRGLLYDVQYAEALLYDTAKNYSLDAVATRWLGESKIDEAMYEWSARAYGGAAVRIAQAGNIYRCPPCLVGPYAEADASLPLRAFQLQWQALQKHGLKDVFMLETELIPVLIGMRYRGVPVDEERAVEVQGYLKKREDEEQAAVDAAAGQHVDVFASASIAPVFDALNLTYPRTPTGKPSFKQDWLLAHQHPIAQKIVAVRKYNKARVTFVENAILEKHVNGKVFPSFHPLRSDEGGAVSGRYSSSHPNAQQIPKRDKELGPLIRSIFVPEEGKPLWIKQDLSQIEYRFFAHYSGDQRLIEAYQDPDTDFHAVVSSFLRDLLPRDPVKNFNFMSLYGGKEKRTEIMLRAMLTREQAAALYETLTGKKPGRNVFRELTVEFIRLYETHFPAAKASLDRDSTLAEHYGEIRTILGRRSTFDLWEPSYKRFEKALPYAQAIQAYGIRVKRAHTYRGLNRRLQGSAADLIKKGVLLAYKEGLFDLVGFPHVTVHDELDNSYHPDLKAHFIRLQKVVETAIPLLVPVLMDAEVGPNWGNVTKENF